MAAFNKRSNSNYNYKKTSLVCKMIILKKCITSLVNLFVQKHKSRYLQKILTEVSSGEITLKESVFLGQMVRELHKSGPIIEIGTLFGRSTLLIAANKKADQKLITVDNFSWNPLGIDSQLHYRVTKSILSEAEELFNLELLKLDKNYFYSKYSGAQPSLVFFDAVHTYLETKKDILWAKRVHANLICGHDYNERHYPGVVEAVNEFGGPKKLCGSIWVL